MMTYNELISFDELYKSYEKCRRNVSWKPGVKSFGLNAAERIYKMSEQLHDGTWKNGKPKPITIWYPKKREGLSIPFKDRIYQRSINDNVLYPTMAKGFIWENSACQLDKGTDHARKICNQQLHRMFIKYGLDFWVWQIDIHQYYQHMYHDKVKYMFEEALDEHRVFSEICKILDLQNNSDMGYNPGSQMIQIAGISYLSPLDHYCKEQLHIEEYQRYMDDFKALGHDRIRMEETLKITVDKIHELGFEVNPDKTHVLHITEGFRFLGFDYRMTETGKIIMTLPSEKVEHERRKLRREVILWSKGKMPKSKIYDGLQSWKSTQNCGNVSKVFMRMDQYLKSLFEEYAS